MANNIEAVIAALRAVLKDAETRGSMDDELDDDWKVDIVNRWISLLPAAWTGRWRHLKLRGRFNHVPRKDFIGHIKATVAYLEAHQEAKKQARVWSWPFAARRATPKPTNAGSVEIADAKGEKPENPRKPTWLH